MENKKITSSKIEFNKIINGMLFYEDADEYLINGENLEKV